MMPTWVTKYVGLPYTPDLNCWGLVRKILAEQCGVVAPAYRLDANGIVMDKFVKAMKDNCWEAVLAPKVFDVVVIRRHGGPGHCGLVVDKDKMIHMQEITGSVVERLSNPVIMNNVVGFFRFKGADRG